MKVIFLEEVENVAKAGDVREVKKGYARNYLFPKDLAVLATPDQLRRVDALKRAEAQRQSNADARAEALAPKLEGLSVVIKARSGPTGRLYGSVSSAAVAQAVADAIDDKIEARDIRMPDAIKAVGEYEVSVGLAGDVQPVVSVQVIEAELEKPTTRRKARAPKVEETEAAESDDAASVEAGEEEAGESVAEVVLVEPAAESDSEPEASAAEADAPAEEAGEESAEPEAKREQQPEQ